MHVSRVGVLGQHWFSLTLFGTDCRPLFLDSCRFACDGLWVTVWSFRACAEQGVIVSFRLHICAGLSGRAGAAARTTMLGCMFQRETPDALDEQKSFQDWRWCWCLDRGGAVCREYLRKI